MGHAASIRPFPAVRRIAERQMEEMDKVVALSKQMLESVDVCNLNELSAMQSQRDSMLRACLKQPIEGEHAEATKAKIQELLRQNEAILEQVNAAKVRLLEEMRESQQNHRAVSAYLTSAR